MANMDMRTWMQGYYEVSLPAHLTGGELPLPDLGITAGEPSTKPARSASRTKRAQTIRELEE